MTLSKVIQRVKDTENEIELREPGYGIIKAFPIHLRFLRERSRTLKPAGLPDTFGGHRRKRTFHSLCIQSLSQCHAIRARQ